MSLPLSISKTRQEAPNLAMDSSRPKIVLDHDLSLSPPLTRDSSPDPSISPSVALSVTSSSSSSRCFSTASTASTFSDRSTASRTSSGSALSRRRGYVRPQGAAFAESAKNRDSVMSLGSIAHLQYYFARTGVLDGKGAQLARERVKGSSSRRTSLDSTFQGGSPETPDGSQSEYLNMAGDDDDLNHWEDSMMLPPTVSTYSHKVAYIPPPPDAETMKEDLQKSLVEVSKVVSEVKSQAASKNTNPETSTIGSPQSSPDIVPDDSQGWHELQGLNVLDVTTLAIRAAKIYYTMHEHPQRLGTIKSERQIREELLSVMDILKRMASRNFVGGLRGEEIHGIEKWVSSVGNLLDKEKDIEDQEARDRESWQWLEGDWADDSKARERAFMNTFLAADAQLPAWTPFADALILPTEFLAALRTGLPLVRLHNRLLKKTKRHFGEITSFHADTAKPYRAAENLRYWIKAAEIRWEIRLKVDVMGVVLGSSEEAWRGFEEAIYRWCRGVREEITREWKEGSVVVVPTMVGPPELNMF